MNKCSEDKIWFVVELCESIKAVRMELANFELYSSVPHEFRVTLSNAYPAKEKDWALFGQFKAENERSVQTFFASDVGAGGVYGKYARVEILSSHGNEHFCLISHFKMFGVSEIELLGGEDDDEDDDDEPGPDSTFEEPADPQPPAEEAKGKGGGIVNFIREKVDETIERFVGVFSPRRGPDADKIISTALDETSLLGNTLAHRVSCPDCDRDRYREVYFILASDSLPLRQALGVPTLRRSMEEGVCQSLGFDFGGGGEGSSVSRSSQAAEFYRTLFGTSRTLALCNVLAVQKKALPRVTALQEEVAATASTGHEHQAANGTSIHQKEVDQVMDNGQGSSSVGSDKSGVAKEDVRPAAAADDVHKSAVSPANNASVPSSQSSDQGGPAPPNGSKDVPKDSTGDESSKTPSSSPPAAASPSSPTSPPSQPHPTRNRGTPATEMQDPPPVVHVAPSPTKDQHQQSSQGGKASEGGPASPSNGDKQSSSPGSSGSPSATLPPLAASSQRDTPWQKLSNKIKVSYEFRLRRWYFFEFLACFIMSFSTKIL